MKELTIGFALPAAGHWVYAATNSGLKPLWIFEEGRWEAETCQANFPTIPLIREFPKKHELPKPDIIAGSPPCKGFSYATAQFFQENHPVNEGILKFARLINDFQPKIFLMENVPAMIKRFNGKYFKNFLSVLDPKYHVAYRFLNAYEYGGAQTRNRLIVIGQRKPISKKFIWPIKRKGKSLEETIGDLKDLPMNKLLDHVWLSKPSLKFYGQKFIRGKPDSSQNVRPTRLKNQPFFTLTGFSLQVLHYEKDRGMSLLELKRIMGLPDDWRFCKTTSLTLKARMIAEGVDIHVLNALMCQIKNLFTTQTERLDN